MSVINISEIVLLLCLLTFAVSYQDIYQLKPALTNYHQELFYPTSNGALTGRVIAGRTPVQITSGLHLKRISLSDIFTESPLILPFHPDSLFTPNTIDQPAETKGQIENYRIALEEEAMEAEKEQNSLAARFDEPALFVDSARPRTTVFVKSKDYNYTYTV